MFLVLDQASRSTPSTLVSSPDVRTRSCPARVPPSARSLRHGSRQKYDSNTWHHNSETRSQHGIRVPTNKTGYHIENVNNSRPNADSFVLDPLMYEEAPPAPNANSKNAASTTDSDRAKKPGPSPSRFERRSLRRARRDVVLLRNALFRQRLWLKEKRNELLEERTSFAETEADILSFIRQNFSERLISELSLARSLYAELETKRAALEAKRDELGVLQYEYDQAETDHNLKETELDEKEQNFEDIICEILGLSNSSKDDASNTSSVDKSQPASSESPSGPVLEPKPEPDRAQFLVSRLRTKSDSVLATIQECFPKARPRINWWILHTFGCSPIDYVQRARDKVLLRDLNDGTLDDEAWARLVFEYWQRQKEPDQTSDLSDRSWAEVSTQELPEHMHIRRFSIGGSYLLLSSEPSKAQYTVDSYDLLFPADPGFRTDFVVQDDPISKELDLLAHRKGRSLSPMSAPATLGLPVCSNSDDVAALELDI
jgi:hypothetical protein